MEKECDKAFDIYMEMDDIEVPLPKTPPPANAAAPATPSQPCFHAEGTP